MKKLVSLILALAMIFAMAICVSAANTEETFEAMTDTGTITINNATAGHTYTLYRVLDIAKTADGVKNVYILNSTWDDFMKAEAAKPGAKFTLSDDKFVKTMETSTADAQAFAKAVVEYAKANDIAPDVSTVMTMSGNFVSNTPRQYGYYVMTTNRGDGEKYTVFAIDQSSVVIDEKNVSKATLQKQVQEDSTSAWGSDNAAEIAQPVSFKIIAGLTAGTHEYKIVDSMPNFELTDDFAAADNFVVEYSGGGVLENGSAYTLDVNKADSTFTLTLNPEVRRYVLDGEKLTITYKAALKPDATIAGEGNTNTATLSYTDKAEDNLTAKTTTHTYKLIVHKVDETNTALEGATFTLSNKDGVMKFHKNAYGEYVVDPDGSIEEITTDSTGNINFCGLDTDDAYTLTETAAPAGYITMDPRTVTLVANSSSTMEITVTNLPGVQMPTTGGMGTTLFYVLGIVLVCGAAVLLVSKKRMSAK